MRILINDYGGYRFPVQLSRALGKRGHEVLHTYCASVQTPCGCLTKSEKDPSGFSVAAISLSKPFNKYGLFKRAIQEMELGKLLVKQVEEFCPNAVLSANTPLGAQSALLRKCLAMKIRFIFWVQDLLGVGIKNNISKKLAIFGKGVGWYYVRLEESLLRKSNEVVVITEDFCPIMTKAGVNNNTVHVIHNWAPLEEDPVIPKSNSWSLEHGLEQKLCLLYSGTLGMKHNPELLVKLALNFRRREDLQLVVITEGLGADFLKEKKAYHRLNNLLLLPFQPFEVLPMVLASADVLIAILEPDAGVFSVPSKVLTYLCAGRPLLLAVPSENLAAKIVKDNQAGIVVPPSDSAQFVDAAMTLLNDPGLRRSLAENGLAYARRTFNIDKITDRFEEIIEKREITKMRR